MMVAENLPGKKERKSVLAPYETTDLTTIAKETQRKGETEEHNHRTKSWFAANRGLKEGEDPESMFLKDEESQVVGKRGLQNSFFCTQKHNSKTVGDENSTICTAVDMKEVDSKSYMMGYNLTHQTCSVKSEKCIFLMDQYSGCKDWSSVPWKHVWYCNMCAIRRREPRHEHVIITSMCSFCKNTRQEKEDSNMPVSMQSSKRCRPRRLGKI